MTEEQREQLRQQAAALPRMTQPMVDGRAVLNALVGLLRRARVEPAVGLNDVRVAGWVFRVAPVPAMHPGERLQAFAPGSTAPFEPLVVDLHSGGWVSRSGIHPAAELARLLTEPPPG